MNPFDKLQHRNGIIERHESSQKTSEMNQKPHKKKHMTWKQSVIIHSCRLQYPRREQIRFQSRSSSTPQTQIRNELEMIWRLDSDATYEKLAKSVLCKTRNCIIHIFRDLLQKQ